MLTRSILVAIVAFMFRAALPVISRAEEVPVEYRTAITKGLNWLANNQKKDGHWEALGGQSRVAMTGMAGMALLMEGSTIREGKYHDNIRRAVDWLMDRSMPNGLIGNPNNPGEGSGYMYGHGFAMLFLSSIVGEEEGALRRRKLVDILERAAKFSRDAQNSRGGWYYQSAKEGRDNDEGSVTVTQMQALRAARNAGIAVPAEAIKDAIQYLHNSTSPQGGVRYSLSAGSDDEGSPALTAAAIACGFSAGEYDSPLVKQWFAFCRSHLRDSFGDGRIRHHDVYTYYYYGQAIYMLGEDGWAKLFPGDKSENLKWSGFRKASFDALLRSQGDDGSWISGQIGPVFNTAVHLSILQLDKAVLPIYQR